MCTVREDNGDELSRCQVCRRGHHPALVIVDTGKAGSWLFGIETRKGSGKPAKLILRTLNATSEGGREAQGQAGQSVRAALNGPFEKAPGEAPTDHCQPALLNGGVAMQARSQSARGVIKSLLGHGEKLFGPRGKPARSGPEACMAFFQKSETAPVETPGEIAKGKP
jgi:hypothetical protein